MSFFDPDDNVNMEGWDEFDDWDELEMQLEEHADHEAETDPW
jgi:hypothetical protein